MVIKQLIYNFCFFYNNILFNIINLQTNNTFFIKNVDFIKKKQISLKKVKFIIKKYKRFIFIYNFKFNKRIIKINNIAITFI